MPVFADKALYKRIRINELTHNERNDVAMTTVSASNVRVGGIGYLPKTLNRPLAWCSHRHNNGETALAG